MTLTSVRIGISRCLLGEGVRYDGGHKRDRFLTDVLGRYVEWVPVCPEVEAGLGTPREPMRLVGTAGHPKLLTVTTKKDKTGLLERFSERRTLELKLLDLSGFVFKARSPSCGTQAVPLHAPGGAIKGTSSGLFARAFMEEFPLMPVVDEDRLHDPVSGDNFIERVFCYRRYQDLLQNGVTRQAVVRFHTIHKYLLLSHSQQQYEVLGRLVGQGQRYRPKALALKYGELFMKALAVKSTVRKHVNVLQHILGYIRNQLATQEKAELLSVIDDYHRGRTPLIVPLTLIKHYVRTFEVSYIQDQVYLNPHPKELMLRNHA